MRATKVALIQATRGLYTTQMAHPNHPFRSRTRQPVTPSLSHHRFPVKEATLGLSTSEEQEVFFNQRTKGKAVFVDDIYVVREAAPLIL